MRKTVLSSILAFVCGISATQAATVTFGSSDFTPGGIPTSTVADGVTITFKAISRTNEIRVLDTTDPSSSTGYGRDADLAGPFDDANDGDLITDRSFGNALIIQEFGSPLIDDEGQGGRMTLSFNQPVTLGTISMLDIDSLVEIFVNGGSTAVASGKTALHGLPNDGPNQWLGFVLGIEDVTDVDVVFNGSGALGEFSFDPKSVSAVPLPAGLPLLLAGVGMLFGAARLRAS